MNVPLIQQGIDQLFEMCIRDGRNTLQRLFQKPIEWVISVKLERYYTKEEILSIYLNKFDFLNNAVGIKTAAHTYFGDVYKRQAEGKAKLFHLVLMV